MPSPARPRGRDGSVRRERLLRAALELYASQGLLGTTTPALAARAGVAEGTIYRHFRSKEHLYNEVYRRAVRWALDQLRSVEVEAPRRVPDRLAALARRLLEGAERDPATLRMLLGVPGAGVLDESSRTLEREFKDALVQLVAAGKSDGLIRAGPAELWASVWLALVSHAADRVCRGEWTAAHTQAALVLEAAWQAIAAPSPGSTSAGGEPPVPAPSGPSGSGHPPAV
ncbi:MAG TPA: TetR/AcrR family transcriptional regulator [Gemmatimonadales bacterium]|jgi:AcrR family transcriptional regulator|nr:TetR/AcrR family transcriptional regulator [Gemmatimonadales bacterium]